MDALPPHLLQAYLPHAFFSDYVHWYDRKNDSVIFRSRKDPWLEKEGDWHLRRIGPKWRLLNTSHTLATTTSKSAKPLLPIFRPLEEEPHVHIMLNATGKAVEISLPRLQLAFYILHGDARIHSRDYRGMMIDADQSIGTLVGLNSKLILRHLDESEKRTILIALPREVQSETFEYTYAKASTPYHVSVTLRTSDTSRVYAYNVDSGLKRVLDNGDLQSKLLLAYLHSLTSHCLPDPLTCCTGAESALKILKSASTRSFKCLTSSHVSLLTLLAKLTPSRTVRACEVQEIHWNKKLPVTSQRPEFLHIVTEIFEQSKRTEIFYPNSDIVEPKGLPSVQRHLHERSMIRNATFMVDGFGAENFTDKRDRIYASRDRYADSERGQRAAKAVIMLVKDPVTLYEQIPSLSQDLFGTQLYYQAIRPASTSFSLNDISFDIKWLTDSTKLLADQWCDWHKYLPTASQRYSTFDVAMWLSTMAYSTSANMNGIQVLAAFHKLAPLASIEPPSSSLNFKLSAGPGFLPKEIDSIARLHEKSINECPEGKIAREEGETTFAHSRRANEPFKRHQREARERFVSSLQKQWRRQKPKSPAKDIEKYINVKAAMEDVKLCFHRWWDCGQFLEYLVKVSAILAGQEIQSIPELHHVLTLSANIDTAVERCRHVTATSIFQASTPSNFGDCEFFRNTRYICSRATNDFAALFVDQDDIPCFKPLPEPDIAFPEQPQSTRNDEIRKALKDLCLKLGIRLKLPCEKDYVRALKASCTALDKHNHDNKSQIAQIRNGTQGLLKEHMVECKKHLEDFELALAQAAKGQSGSIQELSSSLKHTPRISPTFWLDYLNGEKFECLSKSWKDVIIHYALAITQLHRAQRMAALHNKPRELAQEISNIGHTNWDPWKFPENLLLEAESGILIRPIQEVIAEQMRNPPNSENSLCQLNMGEGKSSVIGPMIAAALADSKRLVFMVVGRPQSSQMLQMLVSKLGGLLNRRIYHLPFSRDLRLTATEAENIHSICLEAISNRGIVLILPEHLLSFKLMGIEAILDNRHEVAMSLLETQQLFDASSFKIVDEADENFNPKFELVYTMGSQEIVDFAPRRWTIMQQIMDLVPKYAHRVKEQIPASIDVQMSEYDSFPKVRILQDSAAVMLIELIVEHIIAHGLIGLPTRAVCGSEGQTAIKDYILQPTLTYRQISQLENSHFWTDSTKHAVWLVRGILGCGILRFGLSAKRWRVNYGLDPKRTPNTQLAVPYQFKDGPSPRAEFSHPDVLILLTLLSYYYGGLSHEQLFISFEHLLNSDQAAIEYSEWVRTASNSLPATCRTLGGINIKDRQHCVEQVFPCMRYSKACIDYFLSRLVFPKEVRQFTSKISASGWDMGAKCAHPLTGFSGTKDAMHLLPLSVNHIDLPSQSHVNAMVLGHLLATSSVETLPAETTGINAEHVLKATMNVNPTVRVLIDCGSAILDQNNNEVAEMWLKMSEIEKIYGVVFFQDEELSILDRNGHVEPFQTSPLATQLDACLIYLDEAHSRGTDLKLPTDYRACLTLGQSLTKDKLLQGCMRMRQLGKGQSVVFLIPQEILSQIYGLTSKECGDPIEVEDVILWCIHQTWTDLKRNMALWAVQGHRSIMNQESYNGQKTTTEQAKDFLENEAESLETRYRPGLQGNKLSTRIMEWDMKNPAIKKIIQRCQDFGAINMNSADLEEEQQRELAPEKEEQRQIENPPRLEAADSGLHPHLQHLVESGKFHKDSKAFLPAFQALGNTSAAQNIDLHQLPKDLLVTADFMRTVKRPASSKNAAFSSDSYQRTVQWVLVVPHPHNTTMIQHLVVVSPHEANKLIKLIRSSKKISLHLFAAHMNSSYGALDKLDLYSVGLKVDSRVIPRSLIVQLNLFSGSLYLSSYKDYCELCDFLGLLHTSPQEGQMISADGFITPPTGTWGLKQSPVPFLRTLLMRIRKEGNGLEKTHLGKVLNGVKLEEADFRTDTEMSGT